MGGGQPEEEEVERDPFTQEAIPDIFFVLERENGTTLKVDASSFIDYILSSGDFHDPETRLPLSEETLEMLDVFGRRLGKPSVREAREGLADMIELQKYVRDELSGLENIAGEC